ncbi:MAG: F0F1 ATP synthase subunit epsilon [Hyphomicrobiaceae bacterium]|nr:F0F1 ATP synthase subunit epsilon [Hyphomicrobiaceae bacterium]
MRLRITTPLEVVVDVDGLTAFQAEDASGSFGIQPGHVDFLTTLSVSVVRWTDKKGINRFCAVRNGVLTVSGGNDIALATREAVRGDTLEALEPTILERFHTEIEEERHSRVESTRLQLIAIRQIMRHLRPDGAGGGGFMP